MLKKCSNCEGKGYVFISWLGINVECDCCHMNGKIDVPEGKDICPICKGSGKTVAKVIGINIEADCDNCSGTGFIDQ